MLIEEDRQTKLASLRAADAAGRALAREEMRKEALAGGAVLKSMGRGLLGAGKRLLGGAVTKGAPKVPKPASSLRDSQRALARDTPGGRGSLTRWKSHEGVRMPFHPAEDMVFTRGKWVTPQEALPVYKKMQGASTPRARAAAANGPGTTGHVADTTLAPPSRAAGASPTLTSPRPPTGPSGTLVEPRGPSGTLVSKAPPTGPHGTRVDPYRTQGPPAPHRTSPGSSHIYMGPEEAAAALRKRGLQPPAPRASTPRGATGPGPKVSVNREALGGSRSASGQVGGKAKKKPAGRPDEGAELQLAGGGRADRPLGALSSPWVKYPLAAGGLYGGYQGLRFLSREMAGAHHPAAYNAGWGATHYSAPGRAVY